MYRARHTVFLALLVALVGLLGGLGARADEYEERLKPGRCLCHQGKATWEYLRSPLARPEDPVRCGLLLAGGNCANRPRPPGTSGAGWSSSKEACFWRRHAYSWQIRCSECWKEDACPLNADLVNGADAETRALLAKRIASESKSMDPPIVVAVSPHFYVVTNLDKKLKVRTYRGTYRLMSAHEVAHLYAQRCEQAYDDFLHWFGPPIVLPKPMAVYVVHSEQKDGYRIGARYFGRKDTEMNYAFNYKNRIADGFSGNGFVMSQTKWNSDNHLHGFARHMIGHILFSCWVETNGFESHCPRWAWVGAAHFMEKLLDIHQEWATFCVGETTGSEGPRKKWPRRVRDMARKKMDPIETFFNRNSLSDLSYQDHLRGWSIMDLMLREDRDRWITLLKQLRAAKEEGPAFREILGVTPDQFHERWVERVTGKRKTMGEQKTDAEDLEDPGKRERASILEDAEPQIIAGRIRGIDRIKDRKMAGVLLRRLDTESDLVRETILLVLQRTTDPDILAYLREEGLRSTRPVVRAEVARALGAMGDQPSRGMLEVLLEDRHWMVRANAAWALQQLGDPASRARLEPLLEDRNPKAWISITDAYASWPGRSKVATLAIQKRIPDRLWQVRLTAVRALRIVGTADCLDLLVQQFAREAGRLKREIHATLKVIARDDLGPNPDTWRRWWEQQKKEYGGLPPDLPEMPPNPADERYALPEPEESEDDPYYYGRRIFSKAVCYVLDTSGSMEYNMKIRPDQARKLGDIPTSGRRIDIARKALKDSIEKLDPRTKIRMVFFSSKVKLWKPRLVVANPANVADLMEKIDGIRPDGETNFYGAVKAAVGLHGLSVLDDELPQSPDTVFFLTDGRPTRGEITSMPELNAWVANVNRFAKVNLHVIALGELNVDIDSLRSLAVAGDGDCIWVQEQ